MKKRILTLAGVAIIGMSLLVGCGNKEPEDVQVPETQVQQQAEPVEEPAAAEPVVFEDEAVVNVDPALQQEG